MKNNYKKNNYSMIWVEITNKYGEVEDYFPQIYRVNSSGSKTWVNDPKEIDWVLFNRLAS